MFCVQIQIFHIFIMSQTWNTIDNCQHRPRQQGSVPIYFADGMTVWRHGDINDGDVDGPDGLV